MTFSASPNYLYGFERENIFMKSLKPMKRATPKVKSRPNHRKNLTVSLNALLPREEGKGNKRFPREKDNYRDVPDTAFWEILAQMEADGLSARQGKNQLDSLRNQYGRSYIDEAGFMDA